MREALQTGTPCERLLVQKGAQSAPVKVILSLARESQLPVEYLPAAALKRITQVNSHQGVALQIAAAPYYPSEQLSELCEQPGLLLYLDRIQDPQNLGAILRSACAYGVRAVMLPFRKAVGLTATVVKVSQGAALQLPVIRLRSPLTRLAELRDAGYRLYGLDSRGSVQLPQASFPSRCVLLLGSESSGLSTQLKNLCDTLLTIPMPGGFESLNVSAAAAIALYEYARQAGGSADE